jgi:hypothetical protein
VDVAKVVENFFSPSSLPSVSTNKHPSEARSN